MDCVHRIRYRSSQTQSRALAYEAPFVVQTMGSTPLGRLTLLRSEEKTHKGDLPNNRRLIPGLGGGITSSPPGSTACT